MWFVKGRCGLSQLIAVIILLVIVIGAGIATFVVFSGYLSVESKQVEVSFESLVLYKSVSEPRVIFAATLKNIGNKPIKQLVIKLHNESHYMIPSISEVNPLTPGKCVGVTLTPPLIHSEYYVVGMRYSVWVYAVASDESSFSHTLSVICLGQENGTRWEEKAIYTLTILPGEYGTSDPPPGRPLGPPQPLHITDNTSVEVLPSEYSVFTTSK